MSTPTRYRFAGRHAFVALTLLAVSAFGESAATVSSNAAASTAEIIYPPLTVREGLGLTLPTPPAEHPRLFFRTRDFPALKEKINQPLTKPSWEKIKQSAALHTDGRLKQEDAKGNLDTAVVSAVESKAFLYGFKHDKTRGREAVAAILNLNASFRYDPAKGDVTRDLGRIVLATALVYDWCHDLLSPAQKTELVARMESLATRMEIEWPGLIQGSVTGHGTEAQFSRDLLACAIATYDERPDIYTRVAGRLFAELIPTRNFFYAGGFQPQGSSYGPYRYQWEIFTTLLFARMGCPETVSKLQADVPYSWIYTRRSDGQFLRNGDDFLERYQRFGRPWPIYGLSYVAGFYADPVLQGEALRQSPGGENPLFDFLLIDPALKPQSDLSTLPLTRYFPEPAGFMIARTGWDAGLASCAVVAELKIGGLNFTNHQHLDAGGFQLYYKGPLAVNSGIYQGTTGSYGGEHFTNYYQRTIAHNSLLVYDPSEVPVWKEKPVANDGGQRYPAGGREAANLTELLAGDYKSATVLAHRFGPDALKPEYSYLQGELAPAYGPKVRSFQRSFVFLNLGRATAPAALLVFDRVVSADPGFKKTWLLHSVEEPAIDSNTTTVRRVGRGYSGRLVNTTLLPAADNLTITKIGGPGHEFTVGDANFPQSFPNEDNSGDGAAWRIEVSPVKPAPADHFLNVMQVLDADPAVLPLAVEKIETADLVGARLGDRVVLFAKTAEPLDAPLTLDLTGPTPAKTLIAGVRDGPWFLRSLDASSTPPIALTAADHVLYFPLAPGRHRLSRD